MNAQMLLQSFAGGDEVKIYIEDVFSTYLYTGNGSTQAINNDIDLAGKGGLVWLSGRNNTSGSYLMDSSRGFDNYLQTHSANKSYAFDIVDVLSDGFAVKVSSGLNTPNNTYASWTFRNAPKFFKCATVTKSAGSNATVDLSSLGTVGMVTVKRTDADGDWYTWHRSLDSGKLMCLNQTAAAATLGHITVSGTTLTLVNGVIVDGTYVVYAWAHDPNPNGMIQCGSFATDGSGNATVTTGWEPQWLLTKVSAGTTNDWAILDSMRGMVNSGGASDKDAYLFANRAYAENTNYADSYNPTASGFGCYALTTNATFVYLAILRGPMRVPTDGSKVFKPLIRTGTGAAATVTGVGFAPDVVFVDDRANTDGVTKNAFFDRLRGLQQGLIPHNTASEFNDTTDFLEFNNDCVKLGTSAIFNIANHVSGNYINHFFRRAPGFFDVVCDTGTGSAHAINHNLTVAPELIIRKSRSANTQWEWWHSALAATEKLVLNTTAAKTTDATAFGTLPTATQFYVGASSNTNASAATYVTYLFATCPGVSKVGYYTGNGTSLTVECGFSTGARFILAKSIDDAGDSFIWDSARGIVAANDPHLSLNTTAAEVTTDDSVDPYAGGFIVNQNTATNININGKRYAYLAIA